MMRETGQLYQMRQRIQDQGREGSWLPPHTFAGMLSLRRGVLAEMRLAEPRHPDGRRKPVASA